MVLTFIAPGAWALAFSLLSLFQIAADSRGQIQQHLRNAQQALSRKQPDLAISEFETALSLDPANLEAQANLGVLLYFKGDFVKAAPHLRAAVEGQPGLWKIQALLGLAELRLRDTAHARADLETALPQLKREKVQMEVGKTLIEIYTAAGDLDKAARTVSLLLESQPLDPGLLLLSYRLYSDLASQSILTLAVAAPQGAEMHQVMAIELSRHGNRAAALANYRQAIRINPKLPGLHFQFGNLLYSSDDEKLRSQAEEQFRAALAVNPQDEKAQLMLGLAVKRRGDLNAAYEAVARAVEMQPNDPDACTELAKILISRDELDRARALLAHAIEIDPTAYTAHFRLGTLDRLQGKPEQAKIEFAQYRKYKEMKEKLRSVFQEPTQLQLGPEDDDERSK